MSSSTRILIVNRSSITNSFWQVFNEIDADGNGYITAEEVCVGFGKFGVPLTLDEARALVKAADTDGDGRVSYAGEFKPSNIIICNLHI